MTKSGKRNQNTQKKNEGVKQVNIINIKLFDIVIEFCTPKVISANTRRELANNIMNIFPKCHHSTILSLSSLCFSLLFSTHSLLVLA